MTDLAALLCALMLASPAMAEGTKATFTVSVTIRDLPVLPEAPEAGEMYQTGSAEIQAVAATSGASYTIILTE